MSAWWVVPLALGAVGAVVARIGAGRMRRERRATDAASDAVRARIAAVTSARTRQ